MKMNLKSTWVKMKALTKVTLPRRMLGKKSKERVVLNDPKEEVQETSPKKEDIAQSQDQEDLALEMIGKGEARKAILLMHLSRK